MKHIITGHKYANKPTYYDWDSERNYPNFAIIDNVEIHKDFDSCDEAYEWMLTNLPEYAIGCGIYADNGNFLCNAVKGFYTFLPDLEQDTIINHELELCRLKERMKKKGGE